MEECGHEIRNEFHWSQKSHGAQAIIIAAQNRTSNAAVTYEHSVSAVGSWAIPRLVQLLCGSTITRSVRDEEPGYLGRNEGVCEKDLSESSYAKDKDRLLTGSLVCLPPCTSTVSCRRHSRRSPVTANSQPI